MAGSLLFILGCVVAHVQGIAIDISGCGTTKGCFGIPVGCITDASKDCQAVATWQPNSNGDKVKFELSASGGTTDYYVALGLLEAGSSGMSNALVTDCIGLSSGNPSVAYSMNKAFSNIPIADNTGLNVISTEFADGEVRCVFERDVTVSSSAANFPDLSAGNSYLVNIAHGSASNGVKSYHMTNKAAAKEAVDFTETSVSKGAAVRPMAIVKAHGSLMIVAWILMAGTAITLARYYKDMWPGTTVPVLGKPIWFSFHAICNSLAVLCTIIAFILIFYFKQEWSDLSGEKPSFLKSHPFLGVIVTACALINPIMAAFRPHPGTKNRPLFNWLHWLVGTIAIVAGIVTVLTGINLTVSRSFTKPWMYRLVLAFVVFAFVVDIVLEVMRCMVNRKNDKKEMEMQAPGEQDKETSNKPPANGLRNMLFGFYLLFAIGTTVALIVGIAIN